ncbi:ATP-binding protein [Candidatus Margulisiibacteriota bacterium]
MRNEFNMEIPNEPQYISVARLAISGVANHMDFLEEDVEDIKVCLSEACNTCIDNKKKKKEVIDIHCIAIKDGLAIKVDCEGNSLDERVWEQRHQLGKTFVETLMDDVKYTKGKNGTSVEMRKYFH